MFIRETLITDRKTKKTYRNYQLVESYRTERGPRQRILLTLGSDLELNKQELKELANRIEEILNGVISMLPYSEKIESYAQRFASAIRDRWLTEKKQSKPDLSSTHEFESIDINSIEHIEPRTVGSEHLLLHIAKELELPQKLNELGLSERQVSLALGSIIGRAVFPASERSTHEWLKNRSGLGELIGCNFSSTQLDHLYQISDTLLNSKELLEDYLEDKEMSLYNFRNTMVLYDLTNTYMEGQAKGNRKASHGVSKEKRSDCPLITLGLVINEQGFIHRSSFLPGNISEPKTFIDAIKALSNTSSAIKPVIIMDAGIATDENLQWLRANQYQYVVSARQKAPSMELLDRPIAIDAETTEVRVAYVKTDQQEECWLYCESDAKEAVATSMKNRFQARFETDLKNLNDSLSKPRSTKQQDKILKKIGRLQEKHKAISGCYDIEAVPSPDGKTVVQITWSINSKKMSQKLTGYYFLRSNIQGLAPGDLWLLYGKLRKIEDTFRFMKSSLGMRPVYHQKTRRVDGHLWITILAYHLIQNCMYRLQQAGIHERWETIRNLLSTRIRVTMVAKTEEGKTLHYRNSTKVEAEQAKIYKALQISPQILKAKKFYA